MIKYLSKYRLTAAASLVLAALLFWFAYSEIGQYAVEKQQPATQDYCLIARVIKTEVTKTTTSNLFKLKVEKSVCMLCIDATGKHNTAIINLAIERFQPPQKTTPIYLFNSTFLI